MVYFQNVAAAVAVIIEKDGRILFTVRNREPKLGMLDLPGGFTDPDETSEETCARELKEELNLDISPAHFKYFKSQPNDYLYKGIPYKTEDLVFVAKFPEDAELKLEKSEIQSIKWIKKSEINLDEIGFDSLRKAVKEYVEWWEISNILNSRLLTSNFWILNLDKGIIFVNFKSWKI